MPQYTPGLEKKYPVHVPGSLIRNAYVDYEGEIFAITGTPLTIGKQKVKAPSLGVWSILECFECPFVDKYPDCSYMDVYRALYVNEYRNGHPWKWWRPNAAEEVREWIEDDGMLDVDPEDRSTWKKWDHKVFKYASRLKFADAGEGGGGGSACWFGAETVAGTIAAIGEITNLKPDEILWTTPMALLGHVAAQKVKQNNPKAGVARPKDRQHMKQLFEECIERAKKGQYHPWQKEDPTGYALDPLQGYLHPSLKKDYKRLQKQVMDAKQSDARSNKDDA
jgi:hypothetical protein